MMRLTWEQSAVLLGCLVLAGYLVTIGEDDALLVLIPAVLGTFARTHRDAPRKETE